jgi:hypothetical protein
VRKSKIQLGYPEGAIFRIATLRLDLEKPDWATAEKMRGGDIPTKPVAYLFFGVSRSEFEGSRGVCGIEGWALRRSVSHSGVAFGGGDDDTEVAGVLR